MPSRERWGRGHWYTSPYLLLALTALFWSLNWIVGRGLALRGEAGTITPMALAFLRWALAAAILVALFGRQVRDHWGAVRAHWRIIAWLAFWGTGLHNALSYLGLKYTTATNGVILNSAAPVLIILLGWAVYRDAIHRIQAIGVAVSLLGVVAILCRGDPEVLLGLALNRGDLILLAGMVFWAAYTVFLRLKPAGLPGLVMLTCCACLGVAILLPGFVVEMALFGGRVDLDAVTMGALLYVGVFPTVAGYIFWNRAVAEVGSNVAGIFMHLMPVFGCLLAWLFLGEAIRPYHVAGIVLILAGIAMTTRGRPVGTEAAPD